MLPSDVQKVRSALICLCMIGIPNLSCRYEPSTDQSSLNTTTLLSSLPNAASAHLLVSWAVVSATCWIHRLSLTTRFIGDYDGDHALVIYQEDIVNNFTNSEIKFADEPANLDCMFEPTVTAVSDLLSHHSDLRTQLQPALLGGRYEPNLVGIYSKFHDSASYIHGYGSDEAWRLAYMCVTIVSWSASRCSVR
jgi:hypothetical protein